MKTIAKNDRLKRVSDSEAEKRVRVEGWKYVSKAEWKAYNGKANVVEEEETSETTTVATEAPKKKYQKTKKS